MRKGKLFFIAMVYLASVIVIAGLIQCVGSIFEAASGLHIPLPFMIFIFAIAGIITKLILKSPWVKVSNDFKDLANIVLLINNASAKISRINSESEIYQAINDIFTQSPTFDTVILRLNNARNSLELEQVSLNPVVVGFIDRAFITYKKCSMREYTIPYEKIPLFNEIISSKECRVFTRSELFRQAVGEMVGNMISFMGESDNVGLPIIKNGDVVGVILITAPALAHEFVPAANNLADVISRQLEIIESNQKIMDMNHNLIQKNRELTEATEKSEQLAIEANKANLAKSTFLANMSHEIRTPLNAIVGFIDSVLLDELSQDHREQLTMVKTSSHHLSYLINDILDISKIEAHEIVIESAPFSLKSLFADLESICKSLVIQGQKSIDLRFSNTLPAHEQILSDQFRLRQILVNLLGNAIKFTRHGSVSCSVYAENEKLLFSVEDTGIGIADSQKDIIFEPFKQADASTTREYGGTGLGLAITTKLISLMGGELCVDTHPSNGKSTIFTFSLPYEVVSNPVEETPLELSLSSGEGKAVLVVDDNNINRLVAKKILEKMAFSVYLAENGEIAVNMYRDSQFDIILMDLQMPVLDGFGATEQIRSIEKQIGRRTPIVAMTANTFQEDRIRCNEVGMDGFIGKPFDTNQLLQIIASHTHA